MVKKLILVADDDQHILDLLSYNLEQSGYAVVTASDGEKAMGAARRHNPSLIILDMLMPGLGGEEVCRRLKAVPATAGIPVIILSAISDDADRALALKNGADAYFTKPFSVRDLLERVRSCAA